MSAHKVGFDLYAADPMDDPGASGTITVDRSPAYVPLNSATAESRTLARPTRAGAIVTIAMRVDGGDITLTVTGGYNEDGDTTFTLSDPGQFITLVACEIASATFAWRKLSDYSTANITPTEAAVLDGILATSTELNAVADTDNRVVTLSTTPIAITEATHNRKIMYITKTDGIAITLPAAAPGLEFTFIVGATIAAASTIKSASGADIMIGHATMGNDSSNSTVDWQAVASSTLDTIDLFGTANSTGGIEGQIVKIVGLAANKWFVEIQGDAAGTEASPFADTVA